MEAALLAGISGLLGGVIALVAHRKPAVLERTRTFAFAAVQSPAFVPTGTASVNGASRALPVATSTIDLLGEASGAGSILLALGSGATLAADAHGIANVSNWLVAIDPQTLFVLATGSGAAVSTIYTLWPMEAPASWAAATAVPAEGVGSPTVSAGA